MLDQPVRIESAKTPPADLARFRIGENSGCAAYAAPQNFFGKTCFDLGPAILAKPAATPKHYYLGSRNPPYRSF